MAHAISWFDVPARDLDRAVAFYGAVLGTAIEKQVFGGHAMAVLPHAANDVSGCIVCQDGEVPAAGGPLLYFNVDGRLRAALAEALARGGKLLTATHAIGPYGFRAMLLDSEGNRIALHSMTDA